MYNNQIYVYVNFFLIRLSISGILLKDLDDPLISELPTLIQQPAGWDVHLKCGIWSNHTDFMTLSEVYWDFKHCGAGYQQMPCRKKIENNQSNPWIRILCDDQPCRAIFTISNPTEKDSGLYRCSIQPYKPNDKTTFQIQVVKTFQLDVISNYDFTISAPELVDDLPANTTAAADSQVVLQCRVHSKVQPSIKWFRRQDNNNVDVPVADENYHSRIIQYFENTYELLESAGEKILSDDTYLSKLILNNVSERDSGFYVCVGINYRGFKIREAYLNVLYPDEVDGHQTSLKEFYLLFLIPVGLATIPIIVWCVYLTVKYFGQRKDIGKRSVKTSSHMSTNYTEISRKEEI